VLDISRQTVRVLLLATFVFAVPIFHLGVPLLLAHFGPRWGWNGDYPGPLNFLGALPIVAGAVLLAWTLTTMLLVARSLPPRVRLGFRPTQLVRTGLYAWMRHPMYVGAILMYVGTPLVWGSLAALGISGALIVLLLWRTSMEDRTLQGELPGYAEYASRTRFRLVPGLW